MIRSTYIHFLSILPRSVLSRIIGWFAEIKLPFPLNTLLLSFFCKVYRVDKTEFEGDLKQFNSFSDFFIRDLKPNSRAIEGDFVSPSDSALRGFGPIEDNQFYLVKEQLYSVEELTGSKDSIQKGAFYNFYLSPRDYHHVHSPVSGRVKKIVYLPGDRWPVNDATFAMVPKLFIKNERVAIYLDSPLGKVIVVMVGALNVGKISLDFLEDTWIATTDGTIRTIDFHEQNIELQAGERLGTFHLGSSVVLLAEREVREDIQLKPGQAVRFGEALI